LFTFFLGIKYAAKYLVKRGARVSSFIAARLFFVLIWSLRRAPRLLGELWYSKRGGGVER
jgi:hypothetical protein